MQDQVTSAFQKLRELEGMIAGRGSELTHSLFELAKLEESASYPHVTSALAELRNITLSYDDRNANSEKIGGVNSDVIALSQRFAMLMAEYQESMRDGIITVTEAKRLLRETVLLQQVLIDMKLHLEEEKV